MRQGSRTLSPLRRLLYLLAIAQLPFTTLMGFMIIARGSLAGTGQSAGVVAGALAFFFIGCVVAALPAWLLLRMGRRPAAWKGALIPGSVVALMILGVNNFNERRATGIELEPSAMLGAMALLLVILGIPGALIGAHMQRAHNKAAR